jgi:hypothetical protein
LLIIRAFHDPDLKMLSIGDDPYALITNQPVAHSPDCLIELAFKFDAVQADLHTVGTLGESLLIWQTTQTNCE